MGSDTAVNIDDPYSHGQVARRLEAEGNLRAAEAAWKAAIRAADQLPHVEYKKHYQQELTKHALHAGYQSQPGVGIDQMKQAFHELFALPFINRLQLAGFYARHGALPEAKEVCDIAFRLGVDPVAKDDPVVLDMLRRGRDLRNRLADIMGPEDIERLFNENFEKLDLDGDGFVHERELKQAQFDLTIDADGQKLIRHLLYHYFEVEAANNDEIGIDINGITKNDVKKYKQRTSETWKRLKKNP